MELSFTGMISFFCAKDLITNNIIDQSNFFPAFLAHTISIMIILKYIEFRLRPYFLRQQQILCRQG
jgi:hypothetical protein